MILFVAVAIGILFGTSIYLMLGRELKEICMGFFLLGHAANLVIIEAGRSHGVFPPVLGEGHPIEQLVDPLPQALILTAIVIGFAVQGFLLTLLVVTWRRSGSLDTRELAAPGDPETATEPAASVPVSTTAQP